VPESRQRPWRAFADEVGLLFQIVDDILDEDGYVLEHGAEGARALADEAAERARRALSEVDADTSVLEGIVDELAVRTS
jgi:geranylgeranyl pyrophosphate synthase